MTWKSFWVYRLKGKQQLLASRVYVKPNNSILEIHEVKALDELMATIIAKKLFSPYKEEK